MTDNPLQYQFIVPVPFEENHPTAIPRGILPGIISEYASVVADSIQVPFELPLINALGAVAAVAQRKFRVEMHEGYSEPLNIFALAILPPGERKSAAKDICRFPLLKWEEEQARRVASELKLAYAKKQIQEEASQALLTSSRKCKTTEERHELALKLASLHEELKEPPVPPRLLADDTTPEALAALMASHNQRIAMLEAEGGFFDTLAGRYSSGIPNLDAVLKAWSGEALRIDRRHSDPILLDDPTLTLILSAQPDVLAGAAQTPSFRGRGLLGRLLFLLPKSLVGRRTIETKPVPEKLKLAYSTVIRRILDLPWNVNAQEEPIPYMLCLESEAKTAWLTFAAEIERALAEGAPLAGMRDWGGKLPGQALRIAGLCHVTLHETPQDHPIALKTMQAVLNLANLLIEHAKAAFFLLGADEAIECARTILKWISDDRLDSFTARSCLEKVKGRWPKMSLVNPGLAVLEERGFIMQRERESSGKGRPSKVYLVNPLIFGGQS